MNFISNFDSPRISLKDQSPDTPGRRLKWAARSSGSWAKLLARVFQYDVMCPSCSGRMKILTALIKPGSVRAYLDGVGLPSRAPPIAPSRLDRQLEFDAAACSLRRVSADTPVPTRHAIAATRRFSMSSA